MSEKKQDFRTLTRKFIENHAEEYDLKIHHTSLLKVIAEYCDMTLKHCCLSFDNLAKYSMMSQRHRRKVTAHLLKHSLIEQTFIKGKPIHKIGKIIINKSKEIHETNDIPNLSHEGLIDRYVTDERSIRPVERSIRPFYIER
jgi:hypothetical protein